MYSTVFTISEFLDFSKKSWIKILIIHTTKVMNDMPNPSQIKAWENSYDVLKEQFLNISYHKNTYLIFEYELKRERGRRPDVLLLSGNTVYVLEFKQHNTYSQAQIDQADAYARDIKNYHKKSHELIIKPLLILTGSNTLRKKVKNVTIVSKDKLASGFKNQLLTPFCMEIENWYDSVYEALPSTIQAASFYFNNQKLPDIKKAKSAKIPETINTIKNIISNNNKYNLILITGIPGAGKTLVGLNFVHNSRKATFLSGNGPLISVLQYILKDKTFVQDIHGFLNTYINSSELPNEDVIIFDEAQRIWDQEHVILKKRGNLSEAAQIISIAEKKEHFTIVALIGEGQEIHLGEESGIKIWDNAINNTNSKEWNIFGSIKIKDYFRKNYIVKDNLHLKISLRTHCAIMVQDFVTSILDNNISKAKDIFLKLDQEQYPLYITRSLNIAKKYVKDRYSNELEKTYGLLASSKGFHLKNIGVDNRFGKQPSAPIYFSTPSNFHYCRNLNSCVTEFSCQGLELDFPIICWDNDFLYNNTWIDTNPNKKAKDSFKLRKNTYRVLLTRARDGMIIFIPNNNKFDTTYNFFKSIGLKYFD